MIYLIRQLSSLALAGWCYAFKHRYVRTAYLMHGPLFVEWYTCRRCRDRVEQRQDLSAGATPFLFAQHSPDIRQ